MLKATIRRLRDALNPPPPKVTMQEIRDLERRAKEIREMELNVMRARGKISELTDFALLTRQQISLAKQHKAVVKEYESKVTMVVQLQADV